MALLIDGYNLLNMTTIGTDLAGPWTLERARESLVDFLHNRLTAQELAQTTIVFDALEAPPGLPAVVQRGPLTVRFAKGYRDADELLEELIRKDHVPRSLVVVSSDHQVQRAARRRKARAIDSERWAAELCRRSPAAEDTHRAKPNAPGSADEVRAWLEFFGEPSDNGEQDPPDPSRK